MNIAKSKFSKHIYIIFICIVACMITFILYKAQAPKKLTLQNCIQYGIGKDLSDFEDTFDLTFIADKKIKPDEITDIPLPEKLDVFDRYVNAILYLKDNIIIGIGCSDAFLGEYPYTHLSVYEYYMTLTNWARHHNWTLITGDVSSYRGIPFWEYCPTEDDFKELYMDFPYSDDGLTPRGNTDFYQINEDYMVDLSFVTNDGKNYRIDILVQPRYMDD